MATPRDLTADASAWPPAHPWVRPAAALTLVLAGVAAVWLFFRDAQRHVAGDLAAGPSTGAIGAALLIGCVAAMALAVLLFRPERGDLGALIATSAAWSLTLLVALIAAWTTIATADRLDAWHGAPMLSADDVDAYLAQHSPPGVAPYRIPTGVLVKSMEFLNGDNVQVTGYIWQQYGPDLPEDFVRGVVIAEAVEEAYDAQEVYRFERNGIETIGWYFAAVLRQPFEYAGFPFDEQDLWLRLWSRDFAASTVLVPDFASYVTMDPRALPGIEEEFVYSGWSPVYSGFTLAIQPYSTSFGIGAAGDVVRLPELYFNLVLDRNFVGPFIEHFVFALAVAVLLFGLLILSTDDEHLKARFQLSTAGVFGAASGLLFAVILKHNQLRGVVGSPGLSYIEVIPILLYGGVVAVVVNAIVLASPMNVKFVHHRNNLLPVLAYWPALLGVLLVFTLGVFFWA